jgi:hypothetical protein
MTYVETVQKFHAEQIKAMSEAIKTLSSTLNQITSLKWAAYGAVTLYAIQNDKLWEVLKKFL